MGIVPKELSPGAARRMLAQDSGVYVEEVFRDTPAYKGGVYRGDIILAVNDTPVTTIVELQHEVFRPPVGHDLKKNLMRNGRKLDVSVTSADMPSVGMYAQ